MDGKIHKTYEVYCGGCGRHITHLGERIDPTKADAEKDLRHNYGWVTRQGAWICPDCQDNREQK